jgi:hypothetical protein
MYWTLLGQYWKGRQIVSVRSAVCTPQESHSESNVPAASRSRRTERSDQADIGAKAGILDPKTSKVERKAAPRVLPQVWDGSIVRAFSRRGP